MKKLFISFLVGLACRVGYCDTKISAMSSTTTLNNADIIPVVTNPGTSPANKVITFQNLQTQIGAGGTPGGTGTQIQYNNGGSFGGVPGSSVTATGPVISSMNVTSLYGIAPSSAVPFISPTGAVTSDTKTFVFNDSTYNLNIGTNPYTTAGYSESSPGLQIWNTQGGSLSSGIKVWDLQASQTQPIYSVLDAVLGDAPPAHEFNIIHQLSGGNDLVKFLDGTGKEDEMRIYKFYRP